MSTMKFLILFFLPLVMAMPDKRLVLDSLFNGDELKTLVGGLVCTLGTDESEQACEQECHILIQQDHLLQFGCPLVCKSLQSLIHRFGIKATHSGSQPGSTCTQTGSATTIPA